MSINITNISSTGVTVNWNDPNYTSAEYYTVTITDSAGNNVSSNQVPQGNSSSHSTNISGLSSNITYNVRVRGFFTDGSGSHPSSFDENTNFSTNSGSGSTPQQVSILCRENYKVRIEFPSISGANSYDVLIDDQKTMELYPSAFSSTIKTDLGFLVPGIYKIDVHPYKLVNGNRTPILTNGLSNPITGTTVDISENFTPDTCTQDGNWKQLNFSASNITGTDITLSWDDINSANPSYKIYGVGGDITVDGNESNNYRYDLINMNDNSIVSGITSPYTLQGLTAGTTYDLRLQVVLPFVNSFDSQTQPFPELVEDISANPVVKRNYEEQAVATTVTTDPPGEFIFIESIDIPQAGNTGLVTVTYRSGFMNTGLNPTSTTKQVSKSILIDDYGLNPDLQGTFNFDPIEYGL